MHTKSILQLRHYEFIPFWSSIMFGNYSVGYIAIRISKHPTQQNTFYQIKAFEQDQPNPS